MKRQTKKGPRRSHAMPVQSRSVVVTDYDGCEYITAGKMYRVTYTGRISETIIDDTGYVLETKTPKWGGGTGHLGGRPWRWATL